MTSPKVLHARRLAQCAQTARVISEFSGFGEGQTSALIIAAAILYGTPDRDTPQAMPGYALDLLFATKALCQSQEAIHNTSEHEQLAAAIRRFESQMSVSHGASETDSKGGEQ